MRGLALVFALVLQWPASASARASEWIQPRLSLGPGISLADQFSDFEFVGEGTLSVTPFGPHVSLGHLRRDGAGYTYGEVAAWFVFTVGAGAGRGRTTPLRATSSSDCPSRWPASASGRFLRPHPGGQLELMLKVSMGLTSGWH
jgi:hypothetical protein